MVPVMEQRVEYIRNAWYAVLDQADLPKPGRIQKLRRFSKDLIVWCDGSEMTVQEDRCPHKGVPLSLGRTTKDRVKCPYHGMEFGADGACRRIPQYADQSRIPSNFGVKTYPTRLAYGVLWLWWGDGAPEGNVPYFEEVASETRLTRSASAEFPVSFMRVMESHFDLYHVDYIHGWPLRMGRVIEDAQVVVDGRRIRCDTCFATGGFQIGMKARSTILFPALSLQEYGPGMSFKLVAAAHRRAQDMVLHATLRAAVQNADRRPIVECSQQSHVRVESLAGGRAHSVASTTLGGRSRGGSTRHPGGPWHCGVLAYGERSGKERLGVVVV